MRARREPFPAVDVDRDEDRLDEEGKALECEAEPEDVAERGHEARPEQAELEAEDRSGDDADGEERDHHLRPAPRERAVQRIAGAQPARLGEEHHRRESDPEADERDVNRQRERLHLPRLQEGVLVGLYEHPQEERAHSRQFPLLRGRLQRGAAIRAPPRER